jgi:hypothetical protein
MPSDFESRVEAKAKEIIEAGTSYDYILDVWKSRHFGADIVGKVLLISVGPGSIKNSKGIHVQICGKAGSGKSDAAITMSKLIDPKFVLNSDVTPQALFYPIEGFVDSSVVFIDDIVWKSDLGASVKKITSKFQDGADRTVTTDGIGKKQFSKKRLTFWVTSVDSQADEQIRDRFILVESDSSAAHLAKCLEMLKAKDAGETTSVKESEFETAVCHYIIRDIKEFFDDFGEVIIPFAKNIEFEYDLRAYTMFSDMVKSFAVFAKGARQFDEDCRLVATEEDFHRAVELFTEFGGHSADKYTKAELNFLEMLSFNGYRATKAEMCTLTGKSMGYIGDLLTGRGKGDQQKHGLFYKCSSLTTDGKRPYTLILQEDWAKEIGTGSKITLKRKT